MLRIERLTATNYSDYEALTRAEANGKTGCYCAFWHQRWASMDEWERRQREEPEKNREVMRARVTAGFHVGALAYDGAEPIAWISVSPLSELFWAARRLAQLGEAGLKVAGVPCVNLAAAHRGHGRQVEVLRALADHGRAQGWTALEGYPFDEEAYARHGAKVAWPGSPRGFVDAGFTRVGPHWITHPEWPRSIYRLELVG